jgi:hypothetical protein
MRPAAAQSDSCCDAYFEVFARGRRLLWLTGGAEGRLGKGAWVEVGMGKWQSDSQRSAAL